MLPSDGFGGTAGDENDPESYDMPLTFDGRVVADDAVARYEINGAKRRVRLAPVGFNDGGLGRAVWIVEEVYNADTGSWEIYTGPDRTQYQLAVNNMVLYDLGAGKTLVEFLDDLYHLADTLRATVQGLELRLEALESGG